MRVVVIGAGSAGISVAARLRKIAPELKLFLVDPAKKHYYQPLWTLVGGGVLEKSETERNQRDLIPSGVEWIQEAIAEFKPAENKVLTSTGTEITYETLVVAPGIQINWDAIPGLKAALGKEGVCSNYSFETVDKTWEFIKTFKGGRALFTFPNTPIKCAGAPQKIMYLAEHYFRKAGIREKCRLKFVSAGASIFGVQKYARTLNRILVERDISTLYHHNLVSIDAVQKKASFENLQTKGQD